MTKADWLGIKTAVFLLLIAISGGQATGMGMESFGPAGEHIGRSADWPKGVEDVLRHSSRVYWRDVNGSERAYYDGDLTTINELLALFSKIEMAEHAVAILPGKRLAVSFDRKWTPYAVEFVVPGVFEIHDRQRDRRGNRHLQMPTLNVSVDAELAKRLDELKVPLNVTLQQPVGGASPAESGSSSDDSSDAALRQRVTEFVNQHPRRARVPSPQELLKILRKADAEYAEGFTARGTRIEPWPSNKLITWAITMGRERMVVEQRDVEDANHPPAAGRFEYTHFVGPKRMGSIHGSRLWINGELRESKPWVKTEPLGSTYDLLIGRYLLPLGRGYSRYLDLVSEVKQDMDGRLRVTAERDDGILVKRWDLRVDPRANFLVCSAKGYKRNEETPAYVVETAGVLSGGGRIVAHTAQWIEGLAAPASIAVTSVAGESDEELIQETENRLGKLPEMGKKAARKSESEVSGAFCFAPTVNSR